MKLHVDRTLCASTGMCAGLAPDVFDLDEHGRLVVLDDTPESAAYDDVRQAVLACPVHALSVTEA